ncbi:MAG TPA: site-2 protease family protein [Candidatus Bathyarchaeia archaeon]|jgi:Zn-dependent protease|nr:site-2 protease family protein [Candidatus Bathyarchaeia archaeon]
MNRVSGFRIAKILGIPIYLDPTWLLIFGLITYELAKIVLPGMNLKWTQTQYWTAGVFASLLFFGSVLFHELAHSVVALYYKIPVHSITLFIFGGIARIGREPSKPIQEFNIALAGPLASFFLAGVFGAMALAFPPDSMVVAPAKILGGSNFILAIFNLAPGFPLDGGRIFRAIIWGITKNFSRATLIAGSSGKVVAYAMMGFGGYEAFYKHDLTSGLWLGVVGLYLLNAAQQSIAQMTIRDALAGLHASDVMSHEVPTIDGHITLEEYGAEVLRTGRRCHLVLSGDRLVGMMNVHMLNAVQRSEWANNSVQAAMIPRDKIQWTSPDEPLLRLLERLLTADINQMPVVSGATDEAPQIVGIVTRDSILRVMQTHSELASQFSGK